MKIEEILAQLNDLQDYCEEHNNAEYDDRGTWDIDAEALEEAVRLLGKKVPKTNADKIRAMSDEELVDLLYSSCFCDYCAAPLDANCRKLDCEKELLKGLKQEVD